MKKTRKSRRLQNPLTEKEFYAKIDSAIQHTRKARNRLEADPHEAEEHAYQVKGIMENIETEAKMLLSVSSEKREIVKQVREMADRIIGYADSRQGRPIPNSRSTGGVTKPLEKFLNNSFVR